MATTKETSTEAFQLHFDTNGNEKQKYALDTLLNDNTTGHVGYGGGAGGGKSYLIAAWSWAMAMKYPGCRGFWGRRERLKLLQSTVATYYKFCDDHNIPEELRGKRNEKESKIVFANGSEILWLDLAYSPQDPEYTNLGSTEFTFGAVDEAAEVPEKAIRILSARVGRWRNKEYGYRGKLLETFNPDKGHVYRRFYKPWRDTRIDDFRFNVSIRTDEGEVLDPYVFIPALLTDNKRLAYNDDGTKSPYYLELLASDETTRQRYLFGNFEYDDSPGKLFDYNSLLSMDKKKRKGGMGYLSIDVARAGKDGTEILVWEGYDIVERIREKKSRIDELTKTVTDVATRYGIPMSRVVADENGVGGGLVDNLRCVGFVSSRSQMGKAKKRNYDNLKAQVVHIASQVVNLGLVGWYAGDGFEKLVEDLDSFKQVNIDKDGAFCIIKKEEQKMNLGRSPDTGDAFIMRFIFDIGKTDNIAESIPGIQNDDVYYGGKRRIIIDDLDTFGEDPRKNRIETSEMFDDVSVYS